jgi:ASC-1-like (ASCH) protein
MHEHELKLATEPFEAITSGRKTIESRLYDEKRQAIQLGDIIIFVNRENSSQTLRARVIGLLRYKTFAAMFANNSPEKFGGADADWLLQQINEFYSENDQHQNGVLGIQIEVI